MKRQAELTTDKRKNASTLKQALQQEQMMLRMLERKYLQARGR